MFAYCTIPQLLYYYDALILGSITIAYIIMTMHEIVFSINIAGGDVVVQGVLRLAPPTRPSEEGYLSCTDIFAWSRGCPFMTGTTVYLDWNNRVQCIIKIDPYSPANCDNPAEFPQDLGCSN